MKKLRHRLGHWLLRDAPAPAVRIVADAPGTAATIHKMLLAEKRRRGGKDLGLS